MVRPPEKLEERVVVRPVDTDYEETEDLSAVGGPEIGDLLPSDSSPVTWGTAISMISSVIAMAMTPSLNASSRCVLE